MKKSVLLGTSVALAISMGSAGGAPFKDPNPAVQAHLDAATKLAGTDMDYLYQFRCRAPNPRPAAAPGAPPPAPRAAAAPVPLPPPMKVLDNLYFVGGPDVMGYALKTSAGFILFDTLNTPQEAEDQEAGGLKKLGFSPDDVKDVVIMHGHGDHFGGATYWQKRGAAIFMSPVDWVFSSKPGNGPSKWQDLVPKHDKDLVDGQVLTLGDTSLKFYVTPGHTPGTLSTIFKTTLNGKPHVVGFWGGTGYPADKADLDQYLASLKRFRALAKAAHVDVLISNHTHTDNALEHMEAMRANPTAANPFVIGEANADRFLNVLNECALAQQLRRSGT